MRLPATVRAFLAASGAVSRRPQSPGQALRLGLATTLILSGIKLADVPGANWIVLAGFVGGGIVLLVWGLHELRVRERERGLATDLTPS